MVLYIAKNVFDRSFGQEAVVGADNDSGVADGEFKVPWLEETRE
jgi:hypothetical protein